jgi:hypothetical protein
MRVSSVDALTSTSTTVVENRTVVIVAFAVVAALSVGIGLGFGLGYAFMIAIFGLAIVVSVASFEWAMATFFVVACAQNWYPLFIKAGGFNIRLSQFLTFVLLQTLIVEHVRGTIRLRRAPFFWFFVALFGAMVMSTVLYSPMLKRGLGTTFLLGANIAHYVLAYWLVTVRPGFYRRALRLCAVITVSLVVVGLINVLLLVVDVPVITAALKDVSFQQRLSTLAYTNTRVVFYRSYSWGTHTGCYIATLGYFALGCALDRNTRQRALYGFAASAAAIGVVISLARGPLLTVGASLVTLIMLFLMTGRIRQLSRLLGASLVGLAMIAAMVMSLRSVPYVQGFFARVTQMSNVQQGSALPRIYAWSRMIMDIQNHPITGVGADMYRLYMAEFHRDPTFKYPSENFPLEILHSAGLLGFVPYLIAHIGIVAIAFKSMVRGKRFELPVAGVLAGFVGLWLGGSTTNIAATGTVYWVVLAIVAAAPYVHSEEASA